MSSNPPPSAPMLSPDHKWVWDGSQWQPIAEPQAQVRESVFPAFEGATRDVPAPVAGPLQFPGPPPAGLAGPVPLNVVRPVAQIPRVAQPNPMLWNQRSKGGNKYLYVAAGALVVLIGIGVVLQVSGVPLPWKIATTPPVAAGPTNSGPQLADRSDLARADRYMKGVITPAVAGLNDTLAILDRGCHGTLTVACSSAVPSTDRAVKNFVAAIDGATLGVPDCIAQSIAKMRRDAVGMDTNLNLMQTAFDQNDSGSVSGYYYRYENSHAALVSDLAAMPQVQQVCDPTVTGP